MQKTRHYGNGLLWSAMSLAFAMNASSALADRTSYHVMSDMHVLPTTLFMNGSQEGAAFATCKQSDSKLVEYSQQLFDQVINKIKVGDDFDEEADHKLVLVPGDLSYNGEKASHEYVANGLAKLEAAGYQVLVVPGNHDIDNANARSYTGSTATKVASVSENEFRTIYNDFGYGEALDRHGLSYVTYIGEDLTVICIDSRTGGIDAETLAWAEQTSKLARILGRTVIGVTHYPVMEHFNQHAKLAPDYIANSDTERFPPLSEVQERLIAAGLGVMFTGHYHLQSMQYMQIGEETDDEYSYLPYWHDIMTSSTCSYPMRYRKGIYFEYGNLFDEACDVTDDAQLIALAKKRNENTARGMFTKLANKFYDKLVNKMDDISTELGIPSIIIKMAVNIPSSAADMAQGMCNNTELLSAYTDLINALANGDEDQNDPETKYQASLDALDGYIISLLNKNYAALLSGTLINAFHGLPEYEEMCGMNHSVFYNYLGTREDYKAEKIWSIPDNGMEYNTVWPIFLADSNDDGVQDADDLTWMMMQSLLYNETFDPYLMDLNGDGQITVTDFVRLISVMKDYPPYILLP